MQSQERLQRIEQLTDVPLMILAVLFIPVLVIPWIFETSETVATTLTAAEWFIWAAFAVALVVKVAVAPSRFTYLRRNWFEVLIVVLPFLRPLRVLRILRVTVVLGLNTEILDRLARQRGVQAIILAALFITVTGGALAFAFERGAEGASITTFEDGIWWAFVTSTTVGYGDAYPVTPAGRGIAMVLMLLGIAALSAVTATVAAFLTREEAESEDSELTIVLARLDDLQREIIALRNESRSGGS